MDDKFAQQLAERKEVNVRKKNKRLGRPRKSDIKKNTKGSRGVAHRPKGDAAIMNEYKARMLTSPKSERVLESIFNAALDDDHKNQAAAWKIVVDRIMPQAMFEQEVVKAGNGRNSININITGIGTTAEVTDDYIDGDVIDQSGLAEQDYD